MKLHVGCGPHYIPGMFNIDLRPEVKTDYCGDMFDLCFPSHPACIHRESASMIWSCHMLEHLSYPAGVCAALRVFNDWLKVGGLLRLAVPDLELVSGYYTHNDPTLMTMYGDTIDAELYKHHSRAERFMFFMRGWEHSIVFDFELLRELMIDAGFKDVKRMPFRRSEIGYWPHDRMPEESMYVEGKK